MNPLLDAIVARTREDLDQRRRLGGLPARVSAPPLGFGRALSGNELALIAEVKPRSPSRGTIRDLPRRGPEPTDEPDFEAALRPEGALGPLIAAYRARAHALSVLVDRPFFGGGLELLKAVRNQVPQPLLAKGFLVDPFQIDEAFAFGADAVLLIVRLLDDHRLREMLEVAQSLGLDALVEVHTDEELERAVAAGAGIIGVNARDLDSLSIDLPEARARLERVPQGTLRVAESGLERREDIEAIRGVADAALIGTTFMSAGDVDGSMEALGW